MSFKKQEFTIIKDDLSKAVDIDDSQGRSVPTNMNYVEDGLLVKDTGYIPVGISTNTLEHSLFNYVKKDGTEYFIRGKGTKLQYYKDIDRQWYDITGSPTFTEGAEFGYIVYDDNLYLCNAVESLYKWTGTAFTEYASAPKGNILEIFEDRLFVTGVTAEPLSVYYSGTGTPTTFAGADVVKPLGTDQCTGLVNYFGSLLIFKESSIWKLTFIYDQVASAFIPKLESQNRNYGAVDRKVISWIENDVWFFNGKEVRSIGFKDNQIGVLGINSSVISEDIKATLALVPRSSLNICKTFYFNRRFYLSVPIDSTENNTTFVCHTLYANKWTKYEGRDKARMGSAIAKDGIIYTTNQSSPYGTIKWEVEDGDDLPLNVYLTIE